MKKGLLLLVLSITAFSCKDPASGETADSIYYNGDIITMEGDSPQYVEAVAVKDGLIIYTGKEDGIESFRDDNTQEIDLDGKTLLPGFVDGHAHFAGFQTQAIGANLLPAPDGEVQNFQDLICKLTEWKDTEGNTDLTGWIFGLGYDDSVLEEKEHPTKLQLDSVSTDIPIMIIHISGHFCVVNQKGLDILEITSETEVEGGVVRLGEDGEPNGVLEELAALPRYGTATTPKEEHAALFMEAAQDMALSYGYTTAQEGRDMDNYIAFGEFAEQKKLKLDVVSYIDYAYADSAMYTKWNSNKYINHYRIGGMKLTLDGSPQGRTAWRTQPYVKPPEGKDSSYVGYPAIPKDSMVKEIYKRAFKNNWQILTHANGDAAVDQMIRCMEPMINEYGNNDRRNVLIHGQYIRRDQLETLGDYDVIASLFPLHTFYWGDWHKEIIGDSLGNIISPTRTALDLGVRLTTHTDAPVALPNLMYMVWASVARESRSGVIIGEHERLTPYEALRSITEWSAYQHFEEDSKGTLTKGKLADMVVLNKNPLKVDTDEIKDIVVLKTIKEGNVVYEKKTIPR